MIENKTTALVPVYSEGSIELMKQASLYFDEIVPAFYTRRILARRKRFPIDESENSRLIAELEWLAEKGILDVPAENPFHDGESLNDMDPSKALWIARSSKGMSALQAPSTSLGVEESLYLVRDISRSMTNSYWVEELKKLGLPENFPSLPDVGKSNITAFIPENRGLQTTLSHSDSQEVMEVIIPNLPQPDESTPWEAIFDWRNDDEAKMKLRRLRHWVDKASQRKELNQVHLQNEILCLIDDYRNHMKVHGFNTKSGVLRAIVTTTADIFEDFIKLKWGKLCDLPFQLTGHRIKQIEADMKAPGRELAYIVSAQERFVKK
ncbi:hypothetical protein [Geobacter sulfurreducens]|uniref:hypothetical protein n=1 Tax=Geobacter sulfurreducens TaxID=35554 RepID=UPI002C9A2B82|nr:hypothetical protein [Geobacter sulfurreducens]HML79090.1 hypothetical protein [Geobacter sulfurreducens]